MKIDINNSNYPKELKKLEKPPMQLYFKGNVKLLNTIGIAIIGSRNCTKYGERMAIKFSKELSENGLTIISGMAKGIDKYAHIGSIETTGSTIAVLPCGLNNIYPKENIRLYNQILDNGGLVLTEYEENEKAESKKFLERNRIVSGLAIGTLVVEGGYRSGTSVTARLTKNQNKKVFCIPSSIENPKGKTPNKLIQEGAFLVKDVNDILKQYKSLDLKKKSFRKPREIHSSIKDEFKDIYNILQNHKEVHIDDIAKKLKIDISQVNYKLMMLELDDKIVSLPGNNFKIK